MMTAASLRPLGDSSASGEVLALDDQGFPCWRSRPLSLPPKERAVLALLIQNRSKVVSKHDFAEAIWAPATMSDESLARCISRIRHVLTSIAAEFETIESVYASGYRLKTSAASLEPRARDADAERTDQLQSSAALMQTCLHARQLALRRTPTALTTALRLLLSAVTDHPTEAYPRVVLAETMAGAAGWGLQPDLGFVDEGLRQISEAERLGQPTARAARARGYLLDVAWRFEEAASSWKDALQLQPDSPDALLLHGRHLLVTGHAAAAVERLRKALVLHPYSALLRTTLARALAHKGDMQSAIAQANVACEEHPDSEIAASYRIGLQALVQPHSRLVASAWAMAEQRDASPLALSIVSFALARLGLREDALSVIDASLCCANATPCVAVLHVAALVALSDLQRAISLLERACDARCGVLPMVLRDPANASLRGLPAFENIMQRVF
jgi:DNA-binding winged helix-turn-helix (wHTH) protein